jgi:hypothetical protein
MTTTAAIAVRPDVRTGRVRAFTPADLPAVARLHAIAFPNRRMGAAEVEPYLAELFCGHPWQDDALPSLVYESRPGHVAGCLGVMPRPMRFRGRAITAAVSHHFMVEPDQRSTFAAVHLVRAFLSGPQQLSLAEGNDLSRKFWEGLHGTTAFLYSLHWLRPLRPAGYALSSVGAAGWRRRLVAHAQPVAAGVDAIAARGRSDWFGRRRTDLTGLPIDAASLAAAVEDQRGERALWPRYDGASLRWLLQVLAAKTSSGRLQQVMVRDGRGRLVGWYLYYLRPGRTSEVLQIGGPPTLAAATFDHLLAHARERGAVALSGRLEPPLVPVLASRRCLFRAGASWMLVHSANREIVDAIHRGDALLSPLEGEWWMSA